MPSGNVVGTNDHQTLTNKNFGGKGGYAEFEDDGTLVMHDDATGWADVEFPQSIPKAVGVGNPTLVVLTGSIKGYAYAVGDTNPFDPREIVHQAKIGGTAMWHVHMISMASDGTARGVKFQVDWVIEPATGAYSAPSTITYEITIPANTPALTPFRVDLGSFTIPHIARLVHPTITRIAASGTAPSVDPIVGGLHFHYERDTPAGSRKITEK